MVFGHIYPLFYDYLKHGNMCKSAQEVYILIETISTILCKDKQILYILWLKSSTESAAVVLLIGERYRHALTAS